MKLRSNRFSVPTFVFTDDMPDKARLLLIYLFRESSVEGRVSPGYEAIMREVGIGSRNTVNSHLKLLRKLGWFHYVKRSGHCPTAYWLRIPPRFHGVDIPSSVIQEMPENRKVKYQ